MRIILIMQTTQGQTTCTEPLRARTPPRLEFLDALRGVGALMVVVQHVGDAYFGWSYSFSRNWFNFGKFGVTVFFLVSGFVIPYAFERDLSTRSFWIKMFFRLYPLYWVSLGISIALSNIYPEGFRKHFIRNAIVNITMLQGFMGVPNALDPYWTLFIEMAFYFAFTAFFLTQLHKKTLVWAWAGLAGFMLACVVMPLVHKSHSPVTLTFCFLTMLIGSAFYRRYTGEITMASLGPLLLVMFFVATAGVYLNFSRFSSPEQVTGISVFLAWVFGFFAFSVAFVRRSRTFPSVLLWLGRISYSLYLLHAVVLNILPNIPNGVLGAVAVISASVCVSALSYRFIERPFISIGRRIATNH
jgi:peptidoglycan/LPS O-acetylase OafA/YrhL